MQDSATGTPPDQCPWLFSSTILHQEFINHIQPRCASPPQCSVHPPSFRPAYPATKKPLVFWQSREPIFFTLPGPLARTPFPFHRLSAVLPNGRRENLWGPQP